jgi:NADPH-dependent 2,4-dienoyl-CoA reductase/sulfur reductase-like enzyme
MQVLVVGASLAGLRTAEALRDGGFDGPVRVIGAETALPYDRPPLSKELLLGTKEADQIGLAAQADIDALALDLELGVTARSLDLAGRAVDVGDRRITFDKLVIATGARPRRLPVERHGADLAGVHTLRTLDDSVAIRAAFDAGARVVVVGGGFIGCEVASAAARRGLDVTVVEFLAAPMLQAIGPEMGALMERVHAAAGVRFRCGMAASEIVGGEGVEEVVLADGTRLPADLVVVGVGVAPNTEWLGGSGLTIDNGVVCDSRLHASGHPDVLAVGDAARWHHPTLDRLVRVEHWTNAVETASAAAEQILGQTAPFDPVTYVWSDQHGHRLQLIGLPRPDAEVRIVHGDTEVPKLVALYGSGERLDAVLAVDHPGKLMRYRPLLAEGGSWRDALALAESLGT